MPLTHLFIAGPEQKIAAIHWATSAKPAGADTSTSNGRRAMLDKSWTMDDIEVVQYLIVGQARTRT